MDKRIDKVSSQLPLLSNKYWKTIKTALIIHVMHQKIRIAADIEGHTSYHVTLKITVFLDIFLYFPVVI